MPRPFNIDQVAAEVRRRVDAAWTCSEVFDNRAPVHNPALPYAVVKMSDVARAPDSGVQCYGFIMSFTIVGRFAWDANQGETELKNGKLNDLYEQIFNGQRHFYANADTGDTDLGSYFMLNSASFEELGEEQNRTLEMTVDLTIRSATDTFLF